MKKLTKYTIIIIGMSILFIGMLFLFKPNYWLKIINPLHYEVVIVKSTISNGKLDLNLGVILNSDYFLDIALDSMDYEIKMDSKKFSEGKKAFDTSYSFEDDDTLFIPLTIDLKVIRGIIQKTTTDSLMLEINFNNYLTLPIAGQTSFPLKIEKKIPTPNPPKMEVLRVEKKLLKLHEAIYEIHFKVTNPNDYIIDVQELNGIIEYPDLFLGRIKCRKPFKVMPHSSIETSSEINIDNLELVRDGLKIIMQPKKEWKYNLDIEILIMKNDSSIMPIEVKSFGKMPILKRKD